MAQAIEFASRELAQVGHPDCRQRAGSPDRRHSLIFRTGSPRITASGPAQGRHSPRAYPSCARQPARRHTGAQQALCPAAYSPNIAPPALAALAGGRRGHRPWAPRQHTPPAIQRLAGLTESMSHQQRTPGEGRFEPPTEALPGLPVLPAVLSHGTDGVFVRLAVTAGSHRRLAASFGPDVVGGVEGVGREDLLHADETLPGAARLGHQLELARVELLAEVFHQVGQRVVTKLRRRNEAAGRAIPPMRGKKIRISDNS